MIDSIDASSIVTPDDASPIAFIAPKNATPSCRNLSIEVPLPRKTLKISLRVVPTDRRAISPMTPSNVPTPLKASPLIPEALSHASLSLSMHTERLSAIVIKPSVTATPIPVTKFPIIVPMLPAKRSRIGRPVSRNFSISGNFSIKAPIPIAKIPTAPINETKPVIAPTPTAARGAIALILISTLAIMPIKSLNNLAFVEAFFTLFISANIPTKTSIGIAIAVRDTTPKRADPIKLPIRVNGSNIKEQVAINADNANAFAMALSIPSARANTPINANIGIAIKVNASIPFKAEPTFIPPATLSAKDIATNRADKPNATSNPF